MQLVLIKLQYVSRPYNDKRIGCFDTHNAALVYYPNLAHAQGWGQLPFMVDGNNINRWRWFVQGVRVPFHWEPKYLHIS